VEIMTLSNAAWAAPGGAVDVTRGRVIIVDNDPELLELVSTDLRLEGWDVVAAVRDGLEAISACMKLLPDVLVVDYRMPLGLDGLQVISRVRLLLPSIRLILYTNYRLPGLADEARQLGASYLVKGELATLRARLAQA